MSMFAIYPTVDYITLQDAVNLQFGTNIDNLCVLLFDDFANDSYKSFYYDEMEVFEGHPWQKEEDIRLRNLVRAYLQDVLPDYNCVLIDVSW